MWNPTLHIFRDYSLLHHSARLFTRLGLWGFVVVVGVLTYCKGVPLGVLSTALAAPQVVHFKSQHKNHTMLRAWFWHGMAKVRPPQSPAVMMLHGCSGPVNRRGQFSSRQRYWTRWFRNQGYSVLLIDSFNPRGVRSICIKRKRPVHALIHRPHDALAGLAYLQKQDTVNPNAIFLMGWSNGGSALLATVGRKEAAGSHSKPGFRGAIAFYPGCKSFLTPKRRRWQPKVPTLMLLGSKDNWTPPVYCNRLHSRVLGTADAPFAVFAVKSFEGGLHGFDSLSKPRERFVPDRSHAEHIRSVSLGGSKQGQRWASKQVQAFLKQHQATP